MTMCGSVCTNLSSDPINCGACGHACGCGSTTCTAGLCDAHVIADQQGGPVTLAYNNGNLYWGADVDMRVMTMPADASVAAKVLFPGRTAVRGFAFDAARIYLTRVAFNIVESNTLAGVTGGNFTNAQENGATSIATDGVNVFWTNGGGSGTNPQSIRRAANGAPVSPGTSLITGQVGADGLALDATSVYWTTNDPTNGGVHKIAKTGGAAVDLVAKQARPHSLAVAGGFVYWSNVGDGTAKSGSINRIPVTGGTTTVLASQLSSPLTIAVNADSVFWTDSLDGTVSRLPLAGGIAPQVIVAHEATPNGLALSPTCLYFTDLANGQAGAGSVRAHDLR